MKGDIWKPLALVLMSTVFTGGAAWVVVSGDLATTRATLESHELAIGRLDAAVSSLESTAGDLKVTVGQLDTTLTLTRESLIKAIERLQ